MKSLLPAVSLCLSLSGCYTMIYPPLTESGYAQSGGGQVVTVPDSLAGKGVVIINQNQVIVDRYYQDPYYMRGGWFGSYWDPYYYNPHGYYDSRRWHHGWYDYSPGTSAPEPKKPRRNKDYRRSEASPADLPPPGAGVQAPPPASGTPPVLAEATTTVQPQPSKPDAAPPADSGRALKPVQASSPANPPDAASDKKSEAKPRRGDTRGRSR